MHYHIHASKSYLHSRIIRRINMFQKSLGFTKFEKDEDKYYRPVREENVLIKAQEDDDPLKRSILKGEGQKVSNINPEFK